VAALVHYLLRTKPHLWQNKVGPGGRFVTKLSTLTQSLSALLTYYPNFTGPNTSGWQSLRISPLRPDPNGAPPGLSGHIPSAGAFAAGG
jgi:hypothetical protein